MPSDLHFAAQRGDLQCVRGLLESGADVNDPDEKGITPLKYASAEPQPEMLRLLLAHGASPNLADHRGFTPLHCVAGHGFYNEALEMASILIASGADVNQRSSELGFTPLHEARTIPMIDLLLRHGADPCSRNNDGQLPHEYLREDGELDEADHLEHVYGQLTSAS